MKRYIKPNTSIHTIVPSKMISASPVLSLDSSKAINAEEIGVKQRSNDEGVPEDQNGWSDGLW